MTSRDAEPASKPVYLSKDEALALLDLCLLADTDDSAVRAQLMSKLGEICREFLRAPRDGGASGEPRARARERGLRVLGGARDGVPALSGHCV